MYLCVPDISWFYHNTASINVSTPSRKPRKKMWGHQSSGARAPELWCPLSSWLSTELPSSLNWLYFLLFHWQVVIRASYKWLTGSHQILFIRSINMITFDNPKPARNLTRSHFWIGPEKKQRCCPSLLNKLGSCFYNWWGKQLIVKEKNTCKTLSISKILRKYSERSFWQKTWKT